MRPHLKFDDRGARTLVLRTDGISHQAQRAPCINQFGPHSNKLYFADSCRREPNFSKVDPREGCFVVFRVTLPPPGTFAARVWRRPQGKTLAREDYSAACALSSIRRTSVCSRRFAGVGTPSVAPRCTTYPLR